MQKLSLQFNQRGFAKVEFTDRYGEQCSLQESSLAEEAAIWLGIDHPQPKIMVANQGWTDIPLPTGTLLSGRMHLTVDQVKELLPYLQRFVEKGDLRED